MRNQESKVHVYPLSSYLENSTDVNFDVSAVSVSSPNLAFTKGEWLFASVLVQSNAGNSTINSLLAGSVELYPYQGTNSRDRQHDSQARRHALRRGGVGHGLVLRRSKQVDPHPDLGDEQDRTVGSAQHVVTQ